MTLQTGADPHDGREVFISYRRLDDMPPPDRRMSHGFVNYLLRQVRARLQRWAYRMQSFGKSFKKIEPGDVWATKYWMR